MFNKIRLISIVLFLSFGALGAGYAAWGDSNDIEGNIGTGNCEVKLVFDSITADKDCRGKSYVIAQPEEGVIKDSEVDNLKFSINKIYPGYGATIKNKIRNKSTMAVILSGMNLSVPETLTTDEKKCVNVDVNFKGINKSSNLNDLQTDMNAAFAIAKASFLEQILLEATGETGDLSDLISTHIYLDQSAPSSMMSKSFSFNLKFLTEQY